MNPNFDIITPNFQFDGDFLDATPFGGGHINDTYRARFQKADGSMHQYIIQRINHSIFQYPDQVMHNIIMVTGFIRKKLAAIGQNLEQGTLNFVSTTDGQYLWKSPPGNFWRAYHYIEGARTYRKAVNPEMFYEAAKAYGNFIYLLNDFPLDKLFVTIPDFHNTPRRFQTFLKAIESDPVNRGNSVQKEIEFATSYREEIDRLAKLVNAGQIPERVTHNDTKIDNVMISKASGKSLCVIDLDTVMPGLAMFDFGDLIRSGANPADEDEADLSKVHLDLAVFKQCVHGFLDSTRQILTSVEIDHLAFSAKLITLEQGIRFLTDYLLGDPYYKTQRPHHNLDRCRTQFKLVRDMEINFDQMNQIVERYR